MLVPNKKIVWYPNYSNMTLIFNNNIIIIMIDVHVFNKVLFEDSNKWYV